MAVYAAIVAAAIGAGMAISGASKNASAKRAERSNKRPTYNINTEEYDNLNLAESLASQGLSDSSKQIYTQNADRGMSATIDAVLKGGGDVNTIDRSYDAYTQNLSRLALADDAQRLNNVQLLIAERRRMSDQKDKEWQLNKYAPWADKAKALAEQKAAGEKQMWQGIGMVGSAATSYFGASGQSQNISQVTNGNPTGASGGGSSTSADSTASGIGIGGGASNNYGLNRQTYNGSTGSLLNSNQLNPEAKASLQGMGIK